MLLGSLAAVLVSVLAIVWYASGIIRGKAEAEKEGAAYIAGFIAGYEAGYEAGLNKKEVMKVVLPPQENDDSPG